MFIMFSEIALPSPSLRWSSGARVVVFSALIACRIVH
jgi:hypothetical protein